MGADQTETSPTPAPGVCVPDHHAGAIRFLEEYALITKLPAGSWRVWLRRAGLRVYGSTRWAALREAAERVEGRRVDELWGDDKLHGQPAIPLGDRRR
jgi:hypothetical protein